MAGSRYFQLGLVQVLHRLPEAFLDVDRFLPGNKCVLSNGFKVQFSAFFQQGYIPFTAFGEGFKLPGPSLLGFCSWDRFAYWVEKTWKPL